MYTHNPFKILEKGKWTSHTIARLTVFVHVFCHTRVEGLLKGPVQVYRIMRNPGLSCHYNNIVFKSLCQETEENL